MKSVVVKILPCMLMLAPLMVPSATQAQNIFLCKDASGRTLTSDRSIPECADRAVREMDRNGIVRREIPAPLTAAQKRQKQLDDEKRKAEAIAAAEQKQSDRALLARYRSEDDIAEARRRTADIVQEQIKRESLMQIDAGKRRKAAQTEIDAVKDKKRIPPVLQRKVDDAEQTLADSTKRTREYQAELTAIEAKFDATLERYRELTVATAAR